MKFNSKDVNCIYHNSNGGKGGSKFAQETKITSCTITLTHKTGLEVEGDIPPGCYSKKKMQRLQEELTQQLMSELEEKVWQIKSE